MITADRLGLTVDQLLNANGDYDGAIAASLAHPRRMRRFLAGASGITAIIDRLLELRPDGVPAEVVWPAFEPELFTADPPDPELRRQPRHQRGRGSDRLCRERPPVERCGDAQPLSRRCRGEPGRQAAQARQAWTRLRTLPRARDPACHGARRSGTAASPRRRRPPPTLGRRARPARAGGRVQRVSASRRSSPSSSRRGGRSCYPRRTSVASSRTARSASCSSVATRSRSQPSIERLLADDGLRERLGKGGRAFAERSFSWSESADKLRRFYERVLGTARGGPPALLDDTSTLVDRYARAVPPWLSYATVRDYCDSADRLPILAAANGDMKDVQRPWVLKTIVGTVPPGGAPARDRGGRSRSWRSSWRDSATTSRSSIRTTGATEDRATSKGWPRPIRSCASSAGSSPRRCRPASASTASTRSQCSSTCRSM